MVEYVIMWGEVGGQRVGRQLGEEEGDREQKPEEKRSVEGVTTRVPKQNTPSQARSLHTFAHA
jgi:hypothetical protein